MVCWERIVSKVIAGLFQLIVRPPLTLTVWPVLYAASAEAKNATALARSAGSASRRNGMALVSASRSLGLSPPIEAKSGVSVGPGQITLTLTWLRAISRATALVKAMTPALAGEST